MREQDSDRQSLLQALAATKRRAEIAEERAAASERRLERFFNSATAGVVVGDPTGRIVQANDYYLRLLGFARAEFDAGLVSWIAQTPPEYRQGDLDALAQLRERGASTPYEKEYWRKDGSRVWVLMSEVMLPGPGEQVLAVVIDVTARRRVEEALRTREAMLVTAQKVARLGSWELLPDTGGFTWSEEACSILGVETGSAPGIDDWRDRIHPDDVDRVTRTLAEITPGQAVVAEYRIVRPDCTEGIVLSHAEVVPPRPGVPSRIIGTLLDITARRHTEDQLRDADRRKDEFLAVLSHELRNPLAPMKSSLYILERATPGGEQARRALAVMARQVDHLARLVDDLLDVTRITRGKVQLHRDRVDLVEVVLRTVEDHRAVFAADGVALEATVPTRPSWVDGDPARLAQIVSNLLQNAVKFSRLGGRVTLTLEQAEDRVRLCVRDCGVGIAPALLERIFEPFTQVDETLDHSRGGLGLGLALVKGLVELHGGTVCARSEGTGCGAEFIVSLPLVTAAAAARPSHTPAPVRARRVLIIEDNRDAAAMLHEALQLEQHLVAVAFDGADGLAQAHAFHPDVVVCDVGLPGMDGYEVARAIRRDPALDTVFLVALTGYALPEDQRRAAEAGFDRHLAKPVSVEELEAVLAAE
jgi:PAS domain S-box-containing protein